MTHDDQSTTSTDTLSTNLDSHAADAIAGAFVAALRAGLGTSGPIRSWFQTAANEAAERDSLLAYLRYMALANEEQEDAIRNRYSRATLDWNQLEKRARAHGIAFSVTAQAHHRAAVLDYLDNPGAPTLISHKHLTWFAPIRTSDMRQNAENWNRYQELCVPLRHRDIAHDRAVRGELMGVRRPPARQAAATVAARARAQP